MDVLSCICGDLSRPKDAPEAEAVVVERRGAVTRYTLEDGRWFEVDAAEAAAVSLVDMSDQPFWAGLRRNAA